MDGTITFNNGNSFDDEFLDLVHTGSRRKGRELALRAQYALEMSGTELPSIFTYLKEMNQKDFDAFDFAKELANKTLAKRDELDQYIKNRAKNWDFNRIAVIDLLILRMSICEFMYFWDIPPKVTIDEAIELSKYYSTEQSGKFINGILDTVLSDLKKQGTLVKTGRGLQEGSQRKKCR